MVLVSDRLRLVIELRVYNINKVIKYSNITSVIIIIIIRTTKNI